MHHAVWKESVLNHNSAAFRISREAANGFSHSIPPVVGDP